MTRSGKDRGLAGGRWVCPNRPSSRPFLDGRTGSASKLSLHVDAAQAAAASGTRSGAGERLKPGKFNVFAPRPLLPACLRVPLAHRRYISFRW